MLKTMAIRITQDTLPIAAACLPAGFLLMSVKDMLDCFLVINERGIHDIAEDSLTKTITVTNTWYDEESFWKNYETVTSTRNFDVFFEVRHV